MYEYRAARADGSMCGGSIHGTSEGRARQMLLARGLHPLTLVAQRSHRGLTTSEGTALAGSLSLLADLNDAGMPLLEALRQAEAIATGRVALSMAACAQEVRNGRTLAEALRDGLPGCPEVVLRILHASERQGQLSTGARHTAEYLAARAGLRTEIRRAITYPSLLAATGAVTLIVLFTTVIPRFRDMLGEGVTSAPALTQGLMAVSTLAEERAATLALLLSLFCLWAVAMARTSRGARTLHALVARLPLIGTIYAEVDSALACQAVSGALAAGASVPVALGAAAGVVHRPAVSDRLMATARDVSNGRALGHALRDHSPLTATATSLLAMGAASGSLPDAAMAATRVATGAARGALQTLTSLVEPGLVLLIAGLVGTVAAAVLQALYTLRPV